MAERVVDEVPGAPGRLRFGHALIRDTLYDGLTAAQRIQLHKRTGEALEAHYSPDLEQHLTELAHHFLAAAPAGMRDKAAEYARRAGDGAASCSSLWETHKGGWATPRLHSSHSETRTTSPKAWGCPFTWRAPPSATAEG
jgi:hypothetical protein